MRCWMLGGGVHSSETISPPSMGFWRDAGLALTLHWPSRCLAARCCEKRAWLGRHFPRYRGRHTVFEVGGGRYLRQRESTSNSGLQGGIRPCTHAPLAIAVRCCEKRAWLGRHFPRYRGRHAVFEVVGGRLPATERIHRKRWASGGEPALHTCCSGHRGA